jgi:integrase/recombinase XerD
MKPLRQAVQEYLALRRGLGFKLCDAEHCLRDFLVFAEQRGVSTITTRVAVDWALSKPCARPERAAERLRAVRAFARHHIGTDPATEVPPCKLLPHRVCRRQPYLYTDDEIRRLLERSLRLPPQDGLRPWTYHCLLGLLSVTGMRLGEVIRLEVNDVDLEQDVLTVRDSKFGKSRLIAIQISTRAVLSQYRDRRDQLLQGRPQRRFFVSGRGTPLVPSCIQRTFRTLLDQTKLFVAGAAQRPRMHDMRHRFAVQTLLRWYRAGEDVERRLPELSTYLGHVCIENTYWYLSAYPELMGHAVDRLERRWEVQP